MISKGQQWLLVLGGIVLFSVGGIALGNLTEEKDDEFLDTQPLHVSVTELIDAFDNNEVKAMQIYGNRFIAVTGTIEGIDLDSNDDPVVHFETGQFFSVKAQFDKKRGAGLGEFDTGDNLTVICADLTEAMGWPRLDDCHLP
ncbi:MAG: hypothetical protein R3E02_09895 [Blastomonas sp.]